MLTPPDVLHPTPRRLLLQKLLPDPLRLPPLHDPPSQSPLQLRMRRMRPPRQLSQDGELGRGRDSEAVEV